jgi:hypothetical protein
MTDALHRLVYYSRNLVGGYEDSLHEAVDDILAKSRRNNALAGITGALMFNAGCFAQVLEGPLKQVEETFERIQQDERHGEVSLLALDSIAARSFPTWAMGFVGSSREQAERYARIGVASGFDPSRMDGDEIHRILRELTAEQEVA